MTQITHDTIVMERIYKATPARVFTAWAQVEARERWSAPDSRIRIKYDQADFRVGGLDLVRCIEAGGAAFETVAYYLDIRRDQRIVFAESVTHGNANVSAALISVELKPASGATRLVLTMQIAQLSSEDMHAGYQFGWNAALDNLAKEFAA